MKSKTLYQNNLIYDRRAMIIYAVQIINMVTGCKYKL